MQRKREGEETNREQGGQRDRKILPERKRKRSNAKKYRRHGQQTCVSCTPSKKQTGYRLTNQMAD